MSDKDQSPDTSLIADVWVSFRALPGWVQIWVTFVLAPINAVSLAFLSEPNGIWIALLAYAGMLPNLPLLWLMRGVSNAMAVPHLLPWTILVLWLLLARPEASALYALYLTVLLVVDAISLMFDYRDAIRWLRGERAIVGRG